MRKLSEKRRPERSGVVRQEQEILVKNPVISENLFFASSASSRILKTCSNNEALRLSVSFNYYKNDVQGLARGISYSHLTKLSGDGDRFEFKKELCYMPAVGGHCLVRRKLSDQASGAVIIWALTSCSIQLDVRKKKTTC